MSAKFMLCVQRIHYNVVNKFHQSCVQENFRRWRENRGLTANPNAFGPLTNLPDYTFQDGKPTPLGVRQQTRMDKQRKYAAKIIQLVEEVDYAVERHANLLEERKQNRQQILDNKLKPKGNLLLEKNKNKK